MFCVRLDHENRLGGMNRPTSIALVLACTLVAGFSQTPAGAGRADDVSPKPQSGGGGWKDLFDGKTTTGWRGYRQTTLPEGWQVGDGALTPVGKGGGHDSQSEYEEFQPTVDREN